VPVAATNPVGTDSRSSQDAEPGAGELTEADSLGTRPAASRPATGGGSSPAYELSDDPRRVDVDAVIALLRQPDVYWARWRSDEVIRAQVAGAWRVIGVYASDGAQIGFARAVSDGQALAYLADVYVSPGHRGHGLGTRIVRAMIDEGPGARFRWMLHTGDAHELYRRLGFAAPDQTYLERPASLG
jgi:GNAT superfamily N-acetyltransferase